MAKRTDEKRIKRYPSSIEAEKSMLACLLINRQVVQTCLGRLLEADFLETKHKFILRAMQALDSDNTPIDVISVSEKLPAVGASPEDVDLDYLIALTDFLPSVAGYNTYLSILKKNTLLRGLLKASETISEDVYTSDDAETSLQKAQQLILDLSRNTSGSSLVAISDVLPQVVHDIEEESVNGKVKGLMTGFKNMDFHFNGFKKSDVILLAARPGIGKTAFALNIATNIASNPEYKGANKKNILVFSLEMSNKQLVSRMLCNVGKLSNDKLNRNSLDVDDYIKIRNASSILAESGIYFDQSTDSSPASLFSKCRQFKLEHGHIDLIIIDYLQLMQLSEGARSESRQQEVADMSRGIKLLAKQLDVPIILLSQLSRGAEQRKEKPQLHDLRDSGSIEQDADIVLFLYKEKGQDKENEIIELIVAKYRNGRQTSLAFRWEGQYFEFIPENEKVLENIVTYGTNGSAGADSKGKTANANKGNSKPNIVYNTSESGVDNLQSSDTNQNNQTQESVNVTQIDPNEVLSNHNNNSGISVDDEFNLEGLNPPPQGGLDVFEDAKPNNDGGNE